MTSQIRIAPAQLTSAADQGTAQRAIEAEANKVKAEYESKVRLDTKPVNVR